MGWWGRKGRRMVIVRDKSPPAGLHWGYGGGRAGAGWWGKEGGQRSGRRVGVGAWAEGWQTHILHLSRSLALGQGSYPNCQVIHGANGNRHNTPCKG